MESYKTIVAMYFVQWEHKKQNKNNCSHNDKPVTGKPTLNKLKFSISTTTKMKHAPDSNNNNLKWHKENDFSLSH